MGWFCFRFWLVYRFSLALLAHFNFGISLEVGCVFFCLWKAFDLMWFWIHFLLCICVPALRPENYLLVVINLIWSGLTTHTGRSYKQIYNDLYNWKKSKSERELKRIKNLEKNKETSKDSDSEDDDIQDLPTSGQSLPNTNKDNESARLYPDLPEVERDIDSDSSSGEFDDENGDLEETLGTEKAYYKSTRPMIRKKQEDNVSDKISIKGVFDKIHLKKMNPLNMLKKNENKGEEDKEKEKLKAENEELKKQAKEMKDLEKEKMKQQKAERKELAKLLREKRKVELEAIAKVEKKRRKIANIIELSLNAWRMMASFAILVGNCRKTFLPSEVMKPGEISLQQDAEFLMFFSITLFLEIFLFWIRIFWVHIQHWQLCCQLGCCKHILWILFVCLVAFIIMFLPMHYITEDLDVSWCKFQNGSQYKWIQDVMEYEIV